MDFNVNVTNYKKMHEDFMKNLKGTSIWENFMIISPSCLYIFITCCLSTYFKLQTKNSSLIPFLLEFCTLIIPLVLNFTLLSNYSSILFITSVVIIAIPYFDFKKAKSLLLNKNSLSSDSSKPFISYFRSIVNLITAICILAVDFHIFPRRFAKAETFGYGLMDTGVGFYIFTNAIVIKNIAINSNRTTFIAKTAISVTPLIFLGCIRLFSLSSLDYQQHVSEYGVHWNFFFTLAFVKFFSSVILSFWPKKIIYIAACILTIHQVQLTYGLQDWAIRNIPRNNFLTANREGLISFPGYLALFLIAFMFGEKLRSINTSSDRFKALPRLIIPLTISMMLTLTCETYFNVSRRFANITYVLWMLSLSIYIVIISIFTELALVIYFEHYRIPNVYFTPNLLNSVNFNGLTFFLSSNLLTGLVNICFHTLFLENGISLLIIMIYMFLNCVVSKILYNFKIKLKWW